jgi:hypothetical protein
LREAIMSDGTTQRIRCPGCQIAVFGEYGRPELRYVRVGTLDEPSEVRPAFEIYHDTRALWPAASLQRLDTLLALRPLVS